MTAWNRKQLWSEHDAEQARIARVRALVAGTAVGALVGWVVIAHLSCTELYYVEEYRRLPAATARPECTQDADCALMPSVITCCGDCEPAPPFEAVPVGSLEARLRETADACFPTTRLCDPPSCPIVPEGCQARAVCAAGSCSVEATERCVSR
jgi:hypothetical protein